MIYDLTSWHPVNSSLKCEVHTKTEQILEVVFPKLQLFTPRSRPKTGKSFFPKVQSAGNALIFDNLGARVKRRRSCLNTIKLAITQNKNVPVPHRLVLSWRGWKLPGRKLLRPIFYILALCTIVKAVLFIKLQK